MFRKVARYLTGALFFYAVTFGAAQANDPLFGEQERGGLKATAPSLQWTESGPRSYLRFGIADRSGIKVWKNNLHSGHTFAGSYTDVGKCQFAFGMSRGEQTDRFGTTSDCRFGGHLLHFGAETNRFGHWVQSGYHYRFPNGIETGIVHTRSGEKRHIDMVLSFEQKKYGWSVEATSALENRRPGTVRVQVRKRF